MKYFSEPGLARELDVISLLSDYFKVSKGMVKERSRKREIADVRHIGMWYVNVHMLKSTKVTGRLFDRSHADVIYARNKIIELMEVDPKFEEKILEFKSFIDSKLKSL